MSDPRAPPPDRAPARVIAGLRAATALLTRVRVGRVPQGALGRAVPWFPLVGAVVGLAVAAVYAGAELVLPRAVAATLAVGAGILVTGALHEDGLADVADALGAWSRERRLEILRDPTHGTYGVLALVLSVVLRVAAIASMSPARAVGALVAAHALGRASAGVLLTFMPSARQDGLASAAAAGATRRQSVAGAIMAGAIAVAAQRFGGVPAIAGAAVSVVLVARIASRALGGMTGDVLGAVEQVAESAVLAVAAAT